MKHEAIYELYPNVTMIVDNSDETLTATDKDLNEVSIDMSAVNTKATELQTAKDNEAQTQATLKASAKAKLIAGEALTEDEANTIIL